MQTFQNERNLYRSGPRAYPVFLPPTLKYSASGEAHQIRVQISEQKIKLEKRAKFQKIKLKTIFFVWIYGGDTVTEGTFDILIVSESKIYYSL